jgi:hypothetical protein
MFYFNLEGKLTLKVHTQVCGTFAQGNLNTGGRGWYRLCSHQPTVEWAVGPM